MGVASKYINYILLVCFFGTWVSQSLAKSSTESFSHHSDKCYQSAPEQILLVGTELLAEDPEWEDERDELTNQLITCNLFYSYLHKSSCLASDVNGFVTINHKFIDLSPAYILLGNFRV